MPDKAPEKKTTTAARRTTAKKPAKTPASQALKLLVVIVNRPKAEFYVDLLQGCGGNMQLIMAAEGTANTEMLQILGLSHTEKAVLFCTVRADHAKAALALLEEKFQTVRDGKGIAYTIPLSSIIGATIYRFLSDQRTGSHSHTKEST